MSLRRIGPIDTVIKAPEFSLSSGGDEGLRSGSIRGLLIGWRHAGQLSELVANWERRVTVADQVGVLEYLFSDDELLEQYNGWYLLETFQLGPASHSWSWHGRDGLVPFSLGATYLGDHRQAVLVRSARPLANAFGLTQRSLVGQPYHGGGLVVPPAGSAFTREYDPKSYSPTSVSADPDGVYLDDSFTRPDTPSSLGSTEGGSQAWATSGDSWGISANKGYRSSGGGTHRQATVDTGVTDHEVSATLEAAGGEVAGLVARYVDSANHLLLQVAIGSVPQLYDVTGGSYTFLANADGAVGTSGERWTLRVGADEITVLRNGVMTYTASHAGLANGTRVGVNLLNAVGTSARFDEFAAGPIPTASDLVSLRAAAVSSSVTDTTVVTVPWSDDFPAWVDKRGLDVRAFDRSQAREVYGPAHSFARTTDLLVTNGLVRFWVGNRGLVPFLNVSVFKAGAWRQVGTLLLAHEGTADVLLGARLLRVTPDEVAVGLDVANAGEVVVRLKRWERQLRVTHGAGFPVVSRHVAWAGAPPARNLFGAANGTGQFGNGLRVAAGDAAEFWWPPDLPAGAWALEGRWLPDAASASQPNSGLCSLQDMAGTDVMTLTYVAADRTLRWARGSTILATASLTFAAGAVVWFTMRLTPTGRTLSVRVANGPVVQVSDGVSAAGAAVLRSLSFHVGVTITGSLFGAGLFGAGPFGAGSASGGTYPAGVIDNPRLFAVLSDVEVVRLATATSALGNLPDPEGRMVWHAPFDATPVPLGSPLTNGRIYEATADEGATRSPDANGLTKALAVLSAGANKRSGLAIHRETGSLEVAAIVATTAGNDDLVDHHSQFSAAWREEVRVR